MNISLPVPTCVRVDDLRYSYKKGTEALAGLSFEAQAGRITALLGPNGSGKSTAFKILSTQLLPDSGEALIFGQSVLRNPERVRSQIGVTFQAPSLDPWLSIEENLSIQAALYGLSESDSRTRITDLLKLVRLDDRRKERVKALSGGLARRAELAKTLLSGPRLLLLDEPTTGLDPLARFEFWQELRRLRASGMSLLVTTHLMEEADLCDEILILTKGKLAARGTPEELKIGLGAEVVVVEAPGIELEEPRMRECLATLGKVSFVNGRLRVETRSAERVFEIVRKMLGSRIVSISMGKPTLADVYLSATGESL